MEMFIYGFIAIKSSFQVSNLNGEILGHAVGYFALLITILFLPIQLIRITFFTKKETLEKIDFEEMWGSLY
jgi:hypothetical protein